MWDDERRSRVVNEGEETNVDEWEYEGQHKCKTEEEGLYARLFLFGDVEIWPPLYSGCTGTVSTEPLLREPKGNVNGTHAVDDDDKVRGDEGSSCHYGYEGYGRLGTCNPADAIPPRLVAVERSTDDGRSEGQAERERVAIGFDPAGEFPWVHPIFDPHQKPYTE